MANKRKRSTLRKAREAVDKMVGSMVKNGRIPAEKADHVTLRIGSLPQIKLGQMKQLSVPRKI